MKKKFEDYTIEAISKYMKTEEFTDKFTTGLLKNENLKEEIKKIVLENGSEIFIQSNSKDSVTRGRMSEYIWEVDKT